MITFKIENQEYNIQDNVVIEDKSTEDLNTYIITIPNQDKLDINTMDQCELKIDNKVYTPVINAFNEETIAFNPNKYTYQVSLISETIKLQKIALPNLKITRRVKNPIKMNKKIQQYYEVYIQPQYSELTLSDELLALTNVECTEKMWNRPNMWEVLNDLLIQFNAVVTINNHVIGFKKLDVKKAQIDTKKLSLMNNTQNINDYANRLDIELNNGITDEWTETPKGASQRCETSAILTEDNSQIILDKPIYKIGNVRVFVENTLNPDVSKYYEIDITKYVVEQSVYQTYLTSSGSTEQLADDPNTNYKRLALYYSQGSSTIDGLGYNESLIIGNSKTAITTIVYRELKRLYSKEIADGLTGAIKNDTRRWMFEVNYYPLDTFRFNVVKNSKHNATLIDNQEESYVDTEDFINSEQEKLNRFGNKALIISARYNNLNEVPELNSYIDDYILAERQIVIHNYYVLFKGYMYKDYIRKNMFAGINSKKRNTVIATGSDALVRNDVFEINYQFSTLEQPANKTERYLLSAIVGNKDTEYVTSKIQNAIITTYKEGGINILENNVIWKKLTNYADNKVNVMNFSMVDNYSAGRQVSKKGSIGGYGQQDAKYVDENGEFERISISLRNGGSSYITGDMEMKNYNYDISSKLPLVDKLTMDKIISKDLEVALFDKNIYKDNAEITSITMQFNFLDSDNIIIGKLGKYTPNGIDFYNPKYCIYYSNNELYSAGDTTCKGTKANTTIIDSSKEIAWKNGNKTPYNDIHLLNTDEIKNCKSWAIGNENGELIVGVNCGKEFISTIYLTLK